jgi:hypothetical protein
MTGQHAHRLPERLYEAGWSVPATGQATVITTGDR